MMDMAPKLDRGYKLADGSFYAVASIGVKRIIGGKVIEAGIQEIVREINNAPYSKFITEFIGPPGFVFHEKTMFVTQAFILSNEFNVEEERAKNTAANKPKLQVVDLERKDLPAIDTPPPGQSPDNAA